MCCAMLCRAVPCRADRCSKKRYAGLLWTKPDKADYIDAKGIEAVRRDNCPLVKNVITTCLQKILLEHDIEGAKQFVRNTISDLLQNKLDLSLLVITKALSRDSSKYATKQAHAELASKMKKRDEGSAPALGDRVPFVIRESGKGARAYEKAEDPLFVLENNIPLDYNYYIENQLKNPLHRIFKPLMDNPASLLHGDHTKKIVKPTPKAQAGGIVGFTKRKLTCVGCKATLNSNEQTLCQNCSAREVEIYQRHLFESNALESKYSRLWTQCQRCQGSLHQTVLCSNRDCSIFYMRKKVQKDLEDAQETLQRFNFDW
jgi:DNA polymerase delta subunit 1